MKLKKVLSTILGIGIFLLLNNLDKEYLLPNSPILDYSWPRLVFGVDAQEAQQRLQTKFISVNNDGDIQHFLTTAPNPIDALIENGYSVSNMNKVITTSPLNNLTNNAYIILQTYRTTIEDITISVPYERIMQGDSLCQRLSKKIIMQQGVLGVMTQTIKKTYQGGDLVASEIINKNILRNPVKEVVILEGPNDSPDQVPQIGYNCPYWESYIDNNVLASDKKNNGLNLQCDGNLDVMVRVIKIPTTKAFSNGILVYGTNNIPTTISLMVRLRLDVL